MQFSNLIFITVTTSDENPRLGSIVTFSALHYTATGEFLSGVMDLDSLPAYLHIWRGTSHIVVQNRWTEEVVKRAIPHLDLYRWLSLEDVAIPLLLCGEIPNTELETLRQYFHVSRKETREDILINCWFAYRKQCEMAFLAGKLGQKAQDWLLGKLFGGSQEK